MLYCLAKKPTALSVGVVLVIESHLYYIATNQYWSSLVSFLVVLGIVNYRGELIYSYFCFESKPVFD